MSTQSANVTPMTTEPAALDQLRKDTAAADTLAKRRDTLILEARLAGVTWRAIAAAAGLTELATRHAATRANDGVLPQPAGGPPCRSGDTDCTADCGWCKGTGVEPARAGSAS